MRYTEHAPCAMLKQYVKCIWELQSERGRIDDFESILPDGCPELLFHYGDPFERQIGDGISTQQPAFVYGQIPRFIQLRPTGDIGVIGIKFFPFGLSGFTRIPQHELTGCSVDLKDVFQGGNSDIAEKIALASGSINRITLAENFLKHVLSQRRVQQPHYSGSMAFAVNTLLAGNGNTSIHQIALDLHISRRELERRFRLTIGLTPKQLARIFKLQHAFRIKDLAPSLTSLAYEAGYFDQSHFIRDCREITGVNPGSFFKTERPLTAVFRR